MRVIFYLSVQEHHDRWVGAHTEIWTRTINASIAPPRGDRVELWPDGPMIEVNERYLRHDGQICCDLRTCVIDPDEDEQRYQNHAPIPTTWSWWTDANSTRLRQGLLDGGWTTREE